MVQTTSPTMIVGLLITGIVLLLYGVRQATGAVQQSTNAGVQRVLTKLAR